MIILDSERSKLALRALKVHSRALFTALRETDAYSGLEAAIGDRVISHEAREKRTGEKMLHKSDSNLRVGLIEST